MENKSSTEENKSSTEEKNIMIAITNYGQYIVFEVHSEAPPKATAKHFWVEPMIISITQQQGGPPGISLIPLIQFADRSITKIPAMEKESLLTSPYKANSQIIKSYEEIVIKLRASRAGIDLSTQMPGSKKSSVIDLNPKGGFNRK